MSAGESRAGVALTNLDQPLSPDAGATKRDLVDYLDAVADRIVPGLAGRPLTVLRVLRGQAPFMQKNAPKYTPEWVKTVAIWAESSHREVRYPLCDDRRTLLWLANQRAVEYHPTLGLAENIYRPTHLVLDLDPPTETDFAAVVDVAQLVRQALADSGLAGAVKTSGAMGLHVFVPVDDSAPVEDVAAATRALAARAEALDPSIATTAFIVEDRHSKVFVDSTRAGGATVAAAYSPRLRPGTPVSFPSTGRSCPRSRRGLHRAHRRRSARRPRSVGRVDACPAAVARRAHRTRPHHPRRPGGRDARRQAPRQGPPHRRCVTTAASGTRKCHSTTNYCHWN